MKLKGGNPDYPKFGWGFISFFLSPVCQPQDEELQEGGFKEEILILLRQIREARNLLCPAPDDLHGARQEIIELLNVLSVVSSHLVVRVCLELEFNLNSALMRSFKIYNP